MADANLKRNLAAFWTLQAYVKRDGF